MQCRWGVWHGFNRHNGGMIWESFVASQFLCSRFSEYRILRCRGPALSEGKSQWSEQSALLQCELFEGGRYEWVGAVPRSRSVCVCVCGWMRRVRFIPTGKGGLGLRLNLTLWQLVLTWTVPPVGHLPFTHTHTHQETAHSLLHVFTQEPQTPEEEKASIRLTQTRERKEKAETFL